MDIANKSKLDKEMKFSKGDRVLSLKNGQIYTIVGTRPFSQLYLVDTFYYGFDAVHVDENFVNVDSLTPLELLIYIEAPFEV